MAQLQSVGPDSLFKTGLDRLISEIEAEHKDVVPGGEDFTDRILKDNQGKPVTNHRVHKEFHWFIQEAVDAGHSRVMILGAFQLGKCFVEGELINVLRRKGLSGGAWRHLYTKIPIEEVEPGDSVITLASPYDTPPEWVELEKGAFFSGVQDCYRVKFLSGRTQDVSWNHPFLMDNNEWLEVEDLDEDDFVRLSPSPHGKKWFKSDDAWFLGLYVGDGSYGKISCGDDLIFENLERIGELTFDDGYDYRLKGVGKLLRKFRIHDRKPKRFPYIVYSFDEPTLAHFLAGYFDADGSITKGPYRASMVELYSVKKEWLDNIQDLLLRFGIFSVVREKKGRYGGEEHLSWRLSIWRKSDLIKFKELIPLRSSKKEKFEIIKEKYISDVRKWDEDGWLCDTVVDVKYLGKKRTYGIEVPKTHVHVVNGLVSHNTEQIAIGYVLERIAKDPNVRIKIISNTDNFAIDRVRAVRRYIDADDDFKDICPHIKPTKIWGDSKFIVSRKAASKDATIESFGLFGTAIGSRAELLMFDDPQDWRTAVTEPTTREKCKSVIENVWLPRLTEDGLAILLMNRWHELDVPGWIKNKKEWAWMEVAISEDFKNLEITRCIQNKIEKYSIPSWQPPEFYVRLRADMGERNFVRSCRLIPFSDSELYFPSFEKCCVWGHDPVRFGRNFIKNKNCLVVTGVDYSTSKRPGTVLFTIAIDKNTEQRVPLDLVALKDPAKLPEHMVRLWLEYGVDLFYCENNAVQSVINDLILNFAGYGLLKTRHLPIEGFHTGKNKADPDMGIISLEKEFENKMWQFAFPNKPEPGSEKSNTWSRMYFEVRLETIHFGNRMIFLWLCGLLGKV